MPKQNAKTKRREAEVAGEWYARIHLGCVHTRRPVRTQFQSIDFFGADVVGKKKDGSHVYIQVTAGQASAVSARRKKLEAYPWHETDTVQLIQLVQTEDPANARRKLWFFRVHEFIHKKVEWYTYTQAVEIPKEWFKVWKEPESK